MEQQRAAETTENWGVNHEWYNISNDMPGYLFNILLLFWHSISHLDNLHLMSCIIIVDNSSDWLSLIISTCKLSREGNDYC